jgi:lysophospholipase L1-like esterase
MSFSLRDHYRFRLSRIEQELDTLAGTEAGTIVLLGDSLSEGHPAQKIAGRTVVNMGISGDEADHPDGGVVNRLEPVSRARPEAVFLLIGINDLVNSGKTVEQVADDHARLVGNLRKTAQSARLIVISLLPTRDSYSRFLPSVRRLNTVLEAHAPVAGALYWDLHSRFAGPDGELRAELTYDGLHLGEAGYLLWTGALEELLPRIHS